MGAWFLLLLERKSEDPSSKECCYVWEVMAMGLNEMVLQVNYDNIFVVRIGQITKKLQSPSKKKNDLLIFGFVYL